MPYQMQRLWLMPLSSWYELLTMRGKRYRAWLEIWTWSKEVFFAQNSELYMFIMRAFSSIMRYLAKVEFFTLRHSERNNFLIHRHSYRSTHLASFWVNEVSVRIHAFSRYFSVSVLYGLPRHKLLAMTLKRDASLNDEIKKSL